MAAPDGFKTPRSIVNELPDLERPGVDDYLWDKSGGICWLCDQPLPPDGKPVDVDHRVARKQGKGGPTQRDNLFLAHQACNRRRKNLPEALAKPLIGFQVWASSVGQVTFEDVVAKYVSGGGQAVEYREDNATAILVMLGKPLHAPLGTDPATGTKYFFADVPVRFILNDTETQPRVLQWDHVWELAIDFSKHPVHEPSNLRLIPGAGSTAVLRQFDGQHKTTAQILIGRDTVPCKIYVNPSVPMIQELVLQIQQGIKKRPLSTSDTLAKVGDVVKDLLDSYTVSPGKMRTERGFIDSLPKEQQKDREKEFFADLERAIFMDSDNKLRTYVGAGRTKDFPTTDTVVVQRMIRPLMYRDLLEEDMDQVYGRDHERKAILLILNTIASEMLEGKWGPTASDLDRRRAQNFLYQGSIGWWMGEILRPAIRLSFQVKKAEAGREFLKSLDPQREDTLVALVKQLCSWDVWSTDAANALKAMRSNTVRDVAQEFPKHDEFRLAREIT